MPGNEKGAGRLPPESRRAYNERDRPLFFVALEFARGSLPVPAPAAAAAAARRSAGRRGMRLAVLPQVIESAQDPGDRQDGDGIRPDPPHAERPGGAWEEAEAAAR